MLKNLLRKTHSKCRLFHIDWEGASYNIKTLAQTQILPRAKF